MSLFDSIFGTAIPGLSGVLGLVEGLGAEDRAKRARERALNDMAVQLDRDYQDLKGRNQYGLNKATGRAGDSIAALGRSLGSSLAGAGVYNSSATAGTLANAQRSADQALSEQAGNNYYGEQDLLNSNRRFLTGLQYNLGNQQVGEAQQQLGGAASGLSSFLGSLGQFNLARSGANQQQNALSRPAGGYGNPSVLQPGSGMTSTPSLGVPVQQSYGNFNPSFQTPFALKSRKPAYSL